MPIYKIATWWVLTATLDIEANSLKEAIAKAHGEALAPLGENQQGDYLSDSFVVDHDLTAELNPEEEHDGD